MPMQHQSGDFLDLLEKLPVGAYTCDSAGLITYFNREAVALWGREPKLNDPTDRFCGSFRLFGSDGTPMSHSECWTAQVLLHDRTFNGLEIVIERPNGNRITALAYANPLHDATGKLRGAVNILVDISDRKRAEDFLAAQVADLHRLQELSVRISHPLELQPILEETVRAASAVEGTDLGLLLLLNDSGELEVGASTGFCNEYLEVVRRLPITGGACGAAFAERHRVFIEDIESDPRMGPCREAARLGGFRAVHSTPLIGRTGKAVGVLSTHFREPHRPGEREMHLIDLFARQAADFIENARLYAQLREADRSKNEFLATLAHELRNPLAPIRNAVQILHMKATPVPEVQWALEVVDRQMEQMTRLVDDLLDIARITGNKLELRREPVDLTEVLRVAVETSRPLIEASAQEFIVELPDEPIFLDGDMSRLAQVVSNLLNNSAKYTERGGRIRLSAKRDRDEAVIAVRDTGIGIPTELLPRVFEIFTQGQPSPDQFPMGLGIGLTLVKRLVEMHNGTIEARSEGAGAGSEFIVRLPVVREASAALKRAGTGKPASPPASPIRLLIVDDNLDAAASLALMLRLSGNEIRTAHDGLEAVRIADEFRPDVVVLDIGLPKMNGYEAASRIRQQPWGREMVLIAATGFGQEADRHRSRESGFDHHLVKPVDPAALLQLLASLELEFPRRRARRLTFAS